MGSSLMELVGAGFSWASKHIFPLLIPKLLGGSPQPSAILGVHEFCLDFKADMYELTSEGFRQIEVDETQGLVLEVGMCVLARAELVVFPTDAACLISTSSTLARHFVSVCEGSCYVDRGYKGQVTVELRCNGPVAVTIAPSQVVGKFIYIEASKQPPYQGSYAQHILPKTNLHRAGPR